MYVLGALVFALGIVWLTALGADYDFSKVWQVIIDMPGIVGFIIIIVAVIIATGSFKTFVASVNALLSKKYSISAADKENGIRLFRLIGKTVLYASVAFTVMALMLILMNLTDPGRIGPSVALALNALFLGACINMILIHPAINILQRRYNTEEKPVISEKQVIDKLLELCYRQGISPEEIMDANVIQFKKQ